MADVPAKTRFVGFKVAPEQYRVLEKCAERSGLCLSTWMRSILMQAAVQKPHKGHLRIREPDGATS